MIERLKYHRISSSFVLFYLFPLLKKQLHSLCHISRGQQYFRKNYFALFVAKLCGLITILAIPSILRVLMLTRQSSEPLTAFRRYAATLTHMLEWYEGDLLEPTSRYAHTRVSFVRLYNGILRDLNIFTFNPLKPSGYYIYHLL
jgi:hypothetical protein